MFHQVIISANEINSVTNAADIINENEKLEIVSDFFLFFLN